MFRPITQHDINKIWRTGGLMNLCQRSLKLKHLTLITELTLPLMAHLTLLTHLTSQPIFPVLPVGYFHHILPIFLICFRFDPHDPYHLTDVSLTLIMPLYLIENYYK